MKENKIETLKVGGIRTSDDTKSTLRLVAAITGRKYEQVLNDLLHQELNRLKSEGVY